MFDFCRASSAAQTRVQVLSVLGFWLKFCDAGPRGPVHGLKQASDLPIFEQVGCDVQSRCAAPQKLSQNRFS